MKRKIYGTLLIFMLTMSSGMAPLAAETDIGVDSGNIVIRQEKENTGASATGDAAGETGSSESDVINDGEDVSVGSAESIGQEAGEAAGEATSETSEEEDLQDNEIESADAGVTYSAPAGWVKENGVWHYYGTKGLVTGWQCLSWSGGKNWFYFDGNGAMKTGWQYLSWSGGKNWFYFDGSGTMRTGWQYLSWSGGRNWFYFNGNGAMLTGWQQLKWSGGTSWFYFNTSGAMAANTTVDGYKVDSNGARISNESSAAATSSTTTTVKNGWLKEAGSWYYYQKGKALTGWQYLGWSGGHSWFYFDGNGAMKTGWQYLLWGKNKNWYYFDGNGAMLTGLQYLSWSGGKDRFYFNRSGAMLTGWQSVDGVYYLFASSGAMTKSLNITADGTLSSNQKKMISMCKTVPSPGDNLCSEWVDAVYKKAFSYKTTYHGDACNMYWDYCKSSDLSQLKPGMIVAVSSHSHGSMGKRYGHVAIYIGDGKVMENVGSIRTSDLASWIAYYGDTVTPKWGWFRNNKLAK